KVAGAWNLHALTRDRALDFFVLYSSAATLFGHGGQGGYVAGDAFLSALAERRRGEGVPALAIGWGPVAPAGVAAGGPATPGLARLGIEQGTAALEALLGLDVARVAVVDLDPRALARAQPAMARRPLFSELSGPSPRPAAGDTAARQALRAATS